VIFTHTQAGTHTGTDIYVYIYGFIRLDEILAFVDNPARTSRSEQRDTNLDANTVGGAAAAL